MSTKVISGRSQASYHQRHRKPIPVPVLGQALCRRGVLRGLWQHKVIKNYQRQHSDTDHGVDGWLQAKNEISHLIDESLKLKRRRTHKRIARYRETAEQMAQKAEMIKAGTLRAQTLTSGPDGSRMADHVSSVGAQAQTGTPVQEWAIPVTRPRVERAEIRDIYEDQ